MVRFKNRYIVVEVTPPDNGNKPLMLKGTTLHSCINDKVQQLYGDFGAASIKAGFNAKYCNAHTRIAVVKVRHGPHKFVLNSLPLINDLGGRTVKITILYVGATIKHCFLFIRKHQEKKLEQMWKSQRTDKGRRELVKGLMTLTTAMKSFR